MGIYDDYSIVLTYKLKGDVAMGAPAAAQLGNGPVKF